MKATLPLIIVITLVGCSDGRLSEDEYAKAAQAIGRTAKAEMDEFARTDDFPDPALGVEQAFVFMEKRIDKAIAAAKIAWQSVDSLKPPKKYDGFHAATGALYRASHDGLVQLRTHFRGSPTKIEEVQAAMGADLKAKSIRVAEEAKKLGEDISDELRQFSYMQ